MKEPDVDLILWLSATHEQNHDFLPFTPAKELARLHLVRAHTALFRLVTKTTANWDEEASTLWRKFCDANDNLNDIASKIGIAEELLVTAMTFADAEFGLRDGRPNKWRDHWLGQLEAIERRCTVIQDTRFPSFTGLYNGFRQLAADLIPCQRDESFETLMARLAILLEPITISETGHYTVPDLTERCRHLIDGHPLAELQDLRFERAVWQQVVAQAAQHATRNLFAEALWNLAHRIHPGSISEEAPIDMGAGIARHYWNLSIHDPLYFGLTPDHAVLSLMKTKWGTIVKATTTVKASATPNSAEYARPLTMLLNIEGMRQQLDGGVGFWCPAYCAPGGAKHGRCTCSKNGLPWGNYLIRLNKWAHEGHLGDGLWSFWTYPCV